MKSLTERTKAVLLAFCLILIVGKIVSAQQANAENPATPTKSAVAAAVSEEEKNKFYEMTGLATVALVAGEKQQAKSYAETLLRQAERMKDDWNHGNAVHVANLVLGHLALADGDTAEAKRFLLAAGRTPGSPQLNSFGPNMRLAKELLEKGESETVLEYFELCAKFWKPKFARLGDWKAAVEKKEMPDFGANLRYHFPQ